MATAAGGTYKIQRVVVSFITTPWRDELGVSATSTERTQHKGNLIYEMCDEARSSTPFLTS